MAAPGGTNDHWTTVLYERFPDLYLPILEARREVGGVEAEGVSKILGAAGARKGRLLDLGCGIGRHSIPLAKLGYRVVGYDLSQLFIARARSWASSVGLREDEVKFYQGDSRRTSVELRGRDEVGFDAVVSLFGPLGSFGEEEDEKMLRGLLDICSPGCILVLETLNRDSLLKRLQPVSVQGVTEVLRLFDFSRFDLEGSTLVDDWRFYTELRDGTLRLELSLEVTGRVYTVHELKRLAVETGWEYRQSYGNLITPGPATVESPTLVAVFRKP